MEPIGHQKGKIFYTMGEVAEMFDVNPSLIRFWETKFDILKPQRNGKKNRLFTPEDVDNLKLIYHLVKEKGMTLAGAQKRIRENPKGISRDIEVLDRLLRIKAILVEIRQELREDDGEIYHGDPLEPPVTLGSGARKDIQSVDTAAPDSPDRAEDFDDFRHEDADATLEAADGEQWIGEEIVALDELDTDIEELGTAADISDTEADELLESRGELPLEEPAGDESETPGPVAPEITEEDLALLDEDDEPAYDPAAAGLIDEPDLFGGVALDGDEPEQPADKPRIVEQTLF